MVRVSGGSIRRSFGLAAFLCAVGLGAGWLGGGWLGGAWPGTAALAEEDSSQLRDIRVQIGRLQEQLETLRQRRTGLEGQVKEVDIELKLQRQRVAEAAAALAQTVVAVEEVQDRVEILAGELDAARSELRTRLAALYRLGRQGYLRLLLAADPDAQLLPAMRVARYLAQRDRDAVGHYQELEAGLEQEKDDLVMRQREADSWSQREALRREELADLRRHHTGLLRELDADRRRLASQAIDLADRERRLSSLVDDLDGSASVLSGSPIHQFKGTLEWPIAGSISVGFGTRLDPTYKTRVPHKGIELAPSQPAAAVRVVYPGKVLYAAAFKGYGPTVVVHHAGRVFTLYAGLRELRVQRNDVVALGQDLGPVAERLYFEIRVGRELQDPVDWLR